MAARQDRRLDGAALMVRPGAFGSNPETLASNAFQTACPVPSRELASAARREFDGLSTALRSNGVRVHVFEGNDTPDEVFPNNWVSFHADGSVVLYPLMANSRRPERRNDILESLQRDLGYRVTRLLDLTRHEESGRYLEGTGSLVLDRRGRVAYASLSPRTHLEVLGDFSQQLAYDVVAFAAVDRAGIPVYHTNVLMSLGTDFAVICSAAIADPKKRAAVLAQLRASGRKIIELSFEQLHAFAGNMLELATPTGYVIAMSARACGALSNAQREALRSYGRLLTADIPTIETYGGGSVRCMIAEIHLPRSPEAGRSSSGADE